MRRRTKATAVAGAVALVILVAWLAPWLRFVITLAIAKAIAVLGVTLLLRAGQVSFGQALYIAVAAYSTAFLSAVVPDALVLLPTAASSAALAGLAAGILVMRYRGIFFAMLNLALGMMLYSLLDKLYGLTRGSDGIRLPPLTFGGLSLSVEAQAWTVLVAALALAVLSGAGVSLYAASPMGQALAAIKTREQRLEFLGVPARLVLLAAYVAAAGLAGVGGALTAIATRQVTPSLAYWTTSGELVFISVLGGAESTVGPFLGAAAYEMTSAYAAATFANAWQAILGTVLLLVVTFAPGGLAVLGRSAVARLTRQGRGAVAS